MKTQLLTLMLFCLSGMVWGQEEANVFIQVSPHYENQIIETSQVLRVENTLYARWGGVSSCGDNERAKRNTDKQALVWIKDKLFEYREWKWIRYGWYYETPTVRNEREPWPSGARSCSGNVKFLAFIEFEK